MSTPALRRGLRTLGTLLITLSAISPASSVFIIAPGVISGAGTGAFYSFVAAAVVGVFMAFVYAELASAFPLAGGEYAIVTRTLGRLPGFAVPAVALMGDASIGRKVVQPPQWLGYALLSVGSVLVLHSLAMPKPGGG